MKYRKFHDEKELSLLGFGTMRLPLLADESGAIDEDEAIKMIRKAIDGGVTYMDTAYLYHGGTSEVVLGKALKDGYREKVVVADKMPVWVMKGPEEMQELFDTQLQRLDTDCIDMYLIHNIAQTSWDTIKEFKMYDFLCEKRAEGKIKYIGFSYHGDVPGLFEEVIDSHPWDFCQIQLNYMDKNIQAGLKGYEYAYSKGIPVVVMEPLKGGKLTEKIPPTVEKYWAELDSNRTPANWAFSWVADLPGVMTILSGMSKMEQLDENLQIFADLEPNSLSAEELEIIEKVSDEYNKLISFSCTGCKYCLPCPQGLDIPRIINMRNSWDLYFGVETLKNEFKMFVKPVPSECIDCKECVEKCPQHLDIPRAMKECAEIYE